MINMIWQRLKTERKTFGWSEITRQRTYVEIVTGIVLTVT